MLQVLFVIGLLRFILLHHITDKRTYHLAIGIDGIAASIIQPLLGRQAATC